MFFHALRAASGGGGGGGARFGLALLRIGGRRAGGAAGAGARGRSISATSATSVSVSDDQGVAMEQPKQQPQVPVHDAGAKNKRDDAHKAIGDVMSHSFGEGYSTRCEEEGFGGVYGRYDPEEHRGAEIHPGHPEYDALKGRR